MSELGELILQERRASLPSNDRSIARMMRRIASLCRKQSPLTEKQIIPENWLLRDCMFGPATGIQFLEILPIDTCNHTCSWCFTSEVRAQHILQIELLKATLDNFVKHGGRSVLFSGGGEPLLYRPLYEPQAVLGNINLAHYLVSRGIAIGIITNGSHLSRFIDANRDVLPHLAFIRISLDAWNASVYTSLHRAAPQDFSKALDAIARVLVARGATPAPAVGVSFVVDGVAGFNSGTRDLGQIAAFCNHLGVDFAQLKHAHTSRASEADAVMSQLRFNVASYDWGGCEVWVHRYLTPQPDRDCVIPRAAQVLGSKGDRFPCCHRQDWPIDSSFPSMCDTSSFTVRNCKSKVCRYVSLNRSMSSSLDCVSRKSALERLLISLETHGFHPYRLFPSSPELW